MFCLLVKLMGYLGLPGWLSSESAWYQGVMAKLERDLGGGKGNLQYSCLERPWGQREPGRLLSIGSQRVDMIEVI